jgi:threonyl-tRNA synthetase
MQSKKSSENCKSIVKDYTEGLCIHRAPLGTHERFIGFLIEHLARAGSGARYHAQ